MGDIIKRSDPLFPMICLKILNICPKYPCLITSNLPIVFKREIFSFGPTFTKKSQSYKERRLLGLVPQLFFKKSVVLIETIGISEVN